MIVCVLLPRFELVVAAGGRAALAQGPMALAPEPGRRQVVGEVSQAAEALGIHPGMRLGEALARAPRLALTPPDPVGVADAWERVLARLEAVGAAVESEQPGVACFEARGLGRLHGGSLDAVVQAVRAALRTPARIGAGPSRFCALAAATRARTRSAHIISGAEGLADEPVALLRRRPRTAGLPTALERLGIVTLGQLAALPRAAVADRFGPTGLERPRPRPRSRHAAAPAGPRRAAGGDARARGVRLGSAARARARAADRPPAGPPRAARADAARGGALGGARRGRHVARARRLPRAARRPAADAARADRSAGAAARARRVAAPGGRAARPAGRSGHARCSTTSAPQRAGRLREAVGQARAAAGPDAALRVLPVDPDSRVPERRAVLTPFERWRPMTPAARRLAVPRPAQVLAGRGGRPIDVDGHEVVAVRESWLIEDRWWTGQPAAPALLGGRDDRRARPRRLPRPGGGRGSATADRALLASQPRRGPVTGSRAMRPRVRTQAGQSTLEYVALVLLGARRPGRRRAPRPRRPGWPRWSPPSCARAICVVGAAATASAIAPRASSPRARRATGSACAWPSSRLSGGRTVLRERRSDGTEVVTADRARRGRARGEHRRRGSGSAGTRLGADARRERRGPPRPRPRVARARARPPPTSCCGASPPSSRPAAATGCCAGRAARPPRAAAARRRLRRARPGRASSTRRLGVLGLRLDAEDLIGTRVRPRRPASARFAIRRRNDAAPGRSGSGAGPQGGGASPGSDERYTLTVDARRAAARPRRSPRRAGIAGGRHAAPGRCATLLAAARCRRCARARRAGRAPPGPDRPGEPRGRERVPPRRAQRRGCGSATRSPSRGAARAARRRGHGAGSASTRLAGARQRARTASLSAGGRDCGGGERAHASSRAQLVGAATARGARRLLARARRLPAGRARDGASGRIRPTYANICSCRRTSSSTATRPSRSSTGRRCPTSSSRRRSSAGTRRSR